MNEMIRKRKSIRKYDLTPLDNDVLEKVRAQIENVRPLCPDIRYSVEIVSKTKGILGVKAASIWGPLFDAGFRCEPARISDNIQLITGRKQN